MNDALQSLADDFWEWRLETQPTRALGYGDHRFDDRYEDASREAEDGRIHALREFVARASAIDAATLSADEQVTHDLLVFDASSEADQLEMRHAEFGANHAVGPMALLPVGITQYPLTEPAHAEAMIPKYEGLGRNIAQHAERLREGVRSGHTPHAFTVTATLAQIDAYLATPVADDPFLRLRVPASFDETHTAAWRDDLARTITDHVRPAWQRYRDVLATEVAPAALPDDAPSVCRTEGGQELYRRAIRRHTSVAMTAQEIHQIGLDQIAALGDEYRELGRELLGTTDLTAIYAALRDDPTYRFSDAADIVAASERATATATAAMGDWFGRVPVAPCVVDAVTSGPLAFYSAPASDGSRPGTFYVNTKDPTSWQTFFVEAMAFHEGIPGHHLQLGIASELTHVPTFRTRTGVTAYAEGWGLYAERLADEMGIYASPLDRFGLLVADSMRGCRLVVDTGLHAMGWSRKQAIQFMCDNGPMDPTTVEAEIDRYLGMPGQALAYMVGRLEIMRYRRAAQAALGARFDIKGFHDTVLGSGMVPLPTLERLVDAWVTRQGAVV